MTIVSVTVPGKVMLAGEYSVLSGGRALAVTVDRCLRLEVSARPDFGPLVTVDSNLWPETRRLEVGANPADHTGEPLLEAAARGMELFGVGAASLAVRSDLDVQYGIGSSSALRLAVLLGMEELARARRGEPAQRPRSEYWPTAREAFHLQQRAQGQASGYDIATQLAGGLTVFTPSKAAEDWPGSCTAQSPELPTVLRRLGKLIHVYVGGRGAPTAGVTTDTLAWLRRRGLLDRVAAATDDLIEDLRAALANQDSDRQLALLCRAVGTHRRIFRGSPHFPTAMAEALEALPGCGGIL